MLTIDVLRGSEAGIQGAGIQGAGAHEWIYTNIPAQQSVRGSDAIPGSQFDDLVPFPEVSSTVCCHF